MINLEEINRTSSHLTQQIPLHESNLEPLLQEVYLKYLEINLVQEPFEEEGIERPNTPQEAYMKHDHALIEAKRRLT